MSSPQEQQPLLAGALLKKCGSSGRFKERWCRLYPASLQVHSRSGRALKLEVPVSWMVVCEVVEGPFIGGLEGVLQIGSVTPNRGSEQRGKLSTSHLTLSKSHLTLSKSHLSLSSQHSSTSSLHRTKDVSYLYLHSSDKTELLTWRRQLTACITLSVQTGAHKALFPHYHRGVYTRNKWNCCGKGGVSDGGCKDVTLDTARQFTAHSEGEGAGGGVSSESSPERHMFDEDDVWGDDNIF